MNDSLKAIYKLESLSKIKTMLYLLNNHYEDSWYNNPRDRRIMINETGVTNSSTNLALKQLVGKRYILNISKGHYKINREIFK